jgi:hypothetical protein
MQLAAKSYASPDHIAVQMNRARRMTGEQVHHLRSYLVAELIVLASLGEIAILGLKAHNTLVALLALIPLVANLPRLRDLFLDVFTKECDAVNTAGSPVPNPREALLWPQGRHQLTWPNAFASGDRELYADDGALSNALQTMPTGTYFVAHRTHLLVSVAPALKNVDENGVRLSRVRVSDLAFGSIMHRMFRGNDRSAITSEYGVSLMMNTIRGDALATLAMVGRGVNFVRSVLQTVTAKQSRPSSHVRVNDPPLYVPGEPVDQTTAPRQNNYPPSYIPSTPVDQATTARQNSVSERELTLRA